MTRTKHLLQIAQDLQSLAGSIQALIEVLAEIEESETIQSEGTSNEKQPEAKKVTLADVRAVLATKSHEGLTAEVRALLQKYGASKLSEIDPEKYAALLDDAEGL